MVQSAGFSPLTAAHERDKSRTLNKNAMNLAL